MPTLNFEFDFGWFLDNILTMSEQEIDRVLGLRQREKSLLFTVWAPGVQKVVEDDGIPSSGSLSPPDLLAKTSPSSLRGNVVLSPLSQGQTIPVESCHHQILPSPNILKEQMVSNPVSSTLSRDEPSDSMSSNLRPSVPHQQIQPNDLVVDRHSEYKDMSAFTNLPCKDARNKATSPVEIQEQQEQWQKVMHSRRPGGAPRADVNSQAGFGRGRGFARNVPAVPPPNPGKSTTTSPAKPPRGGARRILQGKRHAALLKQAEIEGGALNGKSQPPHQKPPPTGQSQLQSEGQAATVALQASNSRILTYNPSPSGAAGPRPLMTLDPKEGIHGNKPKQAGLLKKAEIEGGAQNGKNQPPHQKPPPPTGQSQLQSEEQAATVALQASNSRILTHNPSPSGAAGPRPLMAGPRALMTLDPKEGIHGKPQPISVTITANRHRKRKNKLSNVAFDNGLKFRL